MKNIAVFCASSKGNKPLYEDFSRLLGKTLAEKGHCLVYGGGCLGLMDVVSEAALQANGKVIGVIPDFFSEKVIGNKALFATIFVSSMGERKIKIFDISDAFVVLPGGFGTLDELFEALAFSQLGLHHKPVVIANVNGFYNALIEQLNRMEEDGFLNPLHKSMLLTANTVDEIFEKLANYSIAEQEEWFREIKKNNL